MADRSDDIKQLFSHLGLNPGDYQEMREKTRAATRVDLTAPQRPAAPASVVAPPTVAVEPPLAAVPMVPLAVAPTVTIAVPTRVPEPTIRLQPPTVNVAPPVSPPSPAPAHAVPPPALQSQPPSIQPQPQPVPAQPPPAASENAARWPLLRAAVETPTRVAQIERADEPPAIENPPTRRLFDELSRRPVDEAVDQLTAGARRRWIEPAEPLATAPVSPPAQAPAPTPAVEAPPPPASVAPPAAPSASAAADPAPAATGELLSTFSRLVAPERVPQQRPARLHFSYAADAVSPHPRQAREENLEDVFSRISDPRFPR